MASHTDVPNPIEGNRQNGDAAVGARVADNLGAAGESSRQLQDFMASRTAELGGTRKEMPSVLDFGAAPIFPGELPTFARNGIAALADRASGGTAEAVHGSTSPREKSGKPANGDKTAPGDGAATGDKLGPHPTSDDPTKVSFDGHPGRILGLPDGHNTPENQRAIADSMRDFKAHGGTTVGMELLHKGDQKEIDEYTQMRRDKAAGKPVNEEELTRRREALKAKIAGETSVEDDDEKRSKANDFAERQMRILDAAADAGLKVVALEGDVTQMYREDGEKHGFELIKAGITDLVGGKDHETAADQQRRVENTADLRTLMDPKSSEIDRQMAENRLRERLQPPMSEKDKDEFFENLKMMRDAKPSANFEQFQSGIADLSRSPGERAKDPAERVYQWQKFVQDFRNAGMASIIESLPPNERILIVAGAGHVRDKPTSKINDFLHGEKVETIDRQV